jgi:hypothetical protein
MKTQKEKREMIEMNKLYNTENAEKINEYDDKVQKSIGEELFKPKEKTIYLDYFTEILNSTCRSCIKKRYKPLVEMYNEIDDYVSDRLDVTYYLRTLDIIERLKLLTINTEQNMAFEFFKPPNLADKGELSSFEIELKKNKVNNAITVINYFIDKVNKSELDKVDREIFTILDPVLKKHILKNNG